MKVLHSHGYGGYRIRCEGKYLTELVGNSVDMVMFINEQESGKDFDFLMT